MTAATNTASRQKPRTRRSQSILLYTSALTAAFSAVAYELLLASYATFLLGASIFQYSLVLSLMMASMGIGAYVTKYFSKDSARAFFLIEMALCWIALLAIPFLYFVFARDWMPQIFILLFVIAIGAGIGMEIPLLNQLFPERDELPNILFFDYLGGFLGGMAFPLLLLPTLGFFRVAALLAAINAAIALYFFTTLKLKPKKWIWISIASLGVTLIYFGVCERFRLLMEAALFQIKHF